MQDREPEVLGLHVLSQEGRQDLHLVQLESCVRQPVHLEVLGLGEVPLLGVLQEVLQQPENLELGLGAFQAVRKESHETRQKSFVSSAPVEGPSLSEKILFHVTLLFWVSTSSRNSLLIPKSMILSSWSWMSIIVPSLQIWLVGWVKALENCCDIKQKSLLCQV